LEQNYFIQHEKKRWNVRHVIGKVKKKKEFGNLRNEFLCFKWGTPIMLGPIGQYEWSHHSTMPTWIPKFPKVYILWCAIINAWMHEQKKAIYVYII
jgi:hypothetical protein